MKKTNIGIIAHVDAGKTSLTERLLFESGVLEKVGKVDEGSTLTDSLELEKRRGITIKASAVSFEWNEHKFNLIDTPGHTDFIAEVERSLGVLDGVILVISAVEGMQAQTKILLAAVEKMRLPTLIFINKIDRLGANTNVVVQQLKKRSNRPVLELSQVKQSRNSSVQVEPLDYNRERCSEILGALDEVFLHDFVEDVFVSDDQIRSEILNLCGEGHCLPVVHGSAITGAGISHLLDILTLYFPYSEGNPDAKVSGTVFKILRETSGEKIACVRLYEGKIRKKTLISLQRSLSDGKVEQRYGKLQKIEIYRNGDTVEVSEAGPGELVKCWGLEEIQIGDIVGIKTSYISRCNLAEPYLEAGVEANNPQERHKLFEKLWLMAEEDPLIQLKQNESGICLKLFGEVQKQVIQTTLLEQYGLEVAFTESRMICVERPNGIGSAIEYAGSSGNPFCATVGLKIELNGNIPGIQYELDVEPGVLPTTFHRAIEETVYKVLEQGLFGWQVDSAKVTLIKTGYSSSDTTAGDFRKLVPLVLMQAYKQAGATVLEQISKFHCEALNSSLGILMGRLRYYRAVILECSPLLKDSTEVEEDSEWLIIGRMPTVFVQTIQKELYKLSNGEGVLYASADGFEPVKTKPFPERPRTDFNPLNRHEYLLRQSGAY
ncbi:TetM/TetW/TetO/TetS family tetracycline resistance ribosomal protection protein [Paenibacillus polymyxa]|uniref:GTP-binding protein n=1 Tax=Paenibacillus polymyxa TaxID=1406 RepID=UPI001BE9FE49|nr:TetM/TetW/TetO/TetS family tetracycline resistance ribosomal protection protein [Paenibacillus polymyxa]MBT2284246.1 TetM/TetW/TetO/TetS family tetracycline resistance ribosomal protection protein [Paenibacillus polymyxa]